MTEPKKHPIATHKTIRVQLSTQAELDRLRSALQVAEQRNTELVAETWKLGTEIEERAIEQARLREALQAAERENERVLESALKDAAERELFREERDAAIARAEKAERERSTPTETDLLRACEEVVARYDGPGTAFEAFQRLRGLFPGNADVERLELEVKDLRATTTGPAWDKYHAAIARAEKAEREAERLGAERDKAKKEWQSCWEKVQRQAVNLTALNEKVARQGARNAEMLTSLAERTQARPGGAEGS